MTWSEGVPNLFMQFIESKFELRYRLHPLLKNKDKDKIVECLVENMVEDIHMIDKMGSAMEYDPTNPLNDLTKEQLKAGLFEVLK